MGDNAIMTGLIHSLNEREKVEITVFSSNPDRVKKVFGLKAFAPRRQPIQVLQSLRNADALFFTGGTPFYNDMVHMLYFLALAIFARLFGARVVIFSVSLRQLSKTIPLFCLKLICKISSYIGVREYNSLEQFRQLYPREQHKIHLLPDPATQMPCTGNRSYENFLLIERIKLNKPWVAICLRNFGSPTPFHKHHFTKKFNAESTSNYIDTFRRISEWLVLEMKFQVIFLPMHIHPPDDDRIPANEIHSFVTNEDVRKDIFVINKQYDPHTMHAIISHAEFVLGVRFHSLVLSFISHVPSISIGYAQKNQAIMEFFELQRFSHSIESLDFHHIKNTINEVVENKSIIKKQIGIRQVRISHDYKNELNKIMQVIS